MKKPNVEHLFSSRPERFLKQWSSDRLKASGQKGLAKFTIYKASIIEEKLQLDPSVIGMFTKQQSERYTARVEASLEIIDKSGMRKGFVNANAIRSKTVREDATINEREDVLFSLVEDLIIEFDREIANNIKNHLADWLI